MEVQESNDQLAVVQLLEHWHVAALLEASAEDAQLLASAVSKEVHSSSMVVTESLPHLQQPLLPAEQPVVEKPVEQPVVEQPSMVEQPVVEQPVLEQPSIRRAPPRAGSAATRTARRRAPARGAPPRPPTARAAAPARRRASRARGRAGAS